MILSKQDDNGQPTVLVGFTHSELHIAVKGAALLAPLAHLGYMDSAVVLIVENERPGPPNDRVNMDAAALQAKEVAGIMTILGLSLEEEDTLRFFGGIELLVDNSEAFPGTTFRVFTEFNEDSLRAKAVELGFSNEDGLISTHEPIVCQSTLV